MTIHELLAEDPRVRDVARLRFHEWGKEIESSTAGVWEVTTKSEYRSIIDGAD